MSLGQLNFAGLDMVQVALLRLHEFCPPEGYYLADSGGKDSCVVLHLAQVAGVKYDAHYSQGGIDPPELVYFLREHHPETVFERPPMSVWAGVQLHGLPRRQVRWCCELIKEHSGSGRRVLTGIRWAESARRRNRQMVEVCRTDKTKVFVHPIIDWANDDVWEYIRRENISYCKLYDEGWKRLGCILCPMTSAKVAKRDITRWPKIAAAWYRAGERYYQSHESIQKQFPSFAAVWDWWLSREARKTDSLQCVMLDN